ncbi:hypothetical protein [Enterocloster bolteae]|uniref:phage tail protein n=1 Tax=Enterocloster bolteae TaxID=208479 RepID=UPI002A7F6EDA|nr:hypothetical protein [Enterocloster bolteae]
MGKNGQEVTTTFKVDISELKANIQEANRQIRLANSEFKKASSGMDNWGKSADGISAKVKQLNSVIGAQESILGELTAQYEKTAAEKGVDSKAAQELKIKINLLTSDINKNKKAVDSYTQELSKMKDSTSSAMSASDALRAEISQQESELASLKGQYQDTVLEQGETSDAAQDLRQKIEALTGELEFNKQKLDAAQYATSDLGEEQTECVSAVDKLRNTIADQESELDRLKGAYASVVMEQGKNSAEAKKLAKDIYNLSGELNENKAKLKAAEAAADTFDNALEDVGETVIDVKGGFTVLKGALANLVADGFRRAVDAAKDFAKTMITTAADVKAETAQFEQTFGQFGDVATDAINRVSDECGILPTRLNKVGAGIYAFARSSGASVSEAMELMETALVATADSAAYYDKSLEESAETLQSFLKGNFANDAALGVSATEFTRNAKAAELFGKKYANLSEIQKQQVLLRMVTDSQKLSGAMGQAARESDGWENVMGNLNETWRQFKALVGAPVLEELIPLIQQTTNDFKAWTDEINWNEFRKKVHGLFTSFKNLFTFIVKYGGEIITIITTIGTTIAAYFVVSKVMLLASAFKGFFTALSAGKGILSALSVAMKALNLTMAANPIGLIVVAIAGLIAGLVMAYKKVDWFRDGVDSAFRFIKNVVGEVVKAISKFLKNDLEKAFADPIGFLKKNWANIALLIANPFAFGFKMIYQHSETFRNFVNNLFSSILGFLERYFPGITKKFTGFVNVVRNAFVKGDWSSLGKYLVQGIANGIKAGAMLPIKAVQALAKNIWNTFRLALSIHSPSKVMEGEGKQVPAGVAQGITKNTKVAAKATKDLAKVVEENLTINKSKYEKMLDGLVTALKKRLEKQKDLRIKNIEAEMEAEEKASSRRLKMYEDEYNAKVKTLDAQSNSEIAALQAQIDAIVKAEEAREKAQEEAEYNSKVAALKEQILAAESAEDKADLEKDLADTIAAWDEKKRQEQVQAEKDSLQAQIDAIKEKADAEKEILQDQYDKRVDAENNRLEAVKASTDEEKSYWEEYYDSRLDADRINAEARKLVMEDNQDEIIRLLETYNPKWQDAGQSLADSLLNGLNSEKQSIQDAVREAIELGDTIKDQEKELERLNKLAEGQSGGGGGKGSGEGMDLSGLSDMEDLSLPTDDVNEFGDSVEDVGEKAKSSGKLFAGFKTAVKLFLDGTGGTVNQAFRSIGQGILTFFTVTIPGYWTSFIATVSGWGTNILNILKQGWQNIVQFFTETIPSFIDSIGQWFAQLPDKIYDTIVNILGHLLAWGIQLNEFVSTHVANFVNDIVDWFKQLPGKIWEWVTKAMEKVTNWGTNLTTWSTTKPNEFVTNIISFISTLPSKLWEWFIQAMTKVQSWGSDLIQWATTKPAEFVGKIITKISELPGKFWTWLREAWQRVVDWGTDLMTAGAKAAEDLKNSIIDGVKDLPDKLYDIGRNALEGFWGGLKSVAGRIKDWAEKFFQDILDKAEEVLDIASPSKAFKKIGRYVMQGFQIGMDDESKNVLSNMKRMFTDLVDTGRNAATNTLGKMSDNIAKSAQYKERQEPRTKNVNYNFYQTNNSPKALSRLEIYRQSRNLLKGAKLADV